MTLAVMPVPEADVIELYRRQDWEGALALVEPLLTSADQVVRGWAFLHTAGIQYKQAASNALRALRYIDEALPLLQTAPREYVMAGIQGMILCDYLDLTDRGLGYSEGVKATLRANPTLDAWTGPFCTARANLRFRQSEVALATGGREEARRYLMSALRCAERAVLIYSRMSPWDRHDQDCRYRLARVLQADILWALGERAKAEAVVKPLLAALEADRDTSMYHYWLGKLAYREERWAESAANLKLAIEQNLRLRLRDHGLTRRLAQMLAAVYARIGDRAALEQLVRWLIDEAVRARNVVLVYNLERLLINNKGDECSNV